MNTHRPGVEAATIAAMLAFVFVLAVLIAQFNASDGVFYYRHKTYEIDRSAQRYCNSAPNIFQKYPSGTECKNGSQCEADHKQYDSCQQWRSAQAAEQSALYASYSWITTVISTFLAGAAVAAAGLAASFTWRQVNLGQSTAKKQLRAYLGIGTDQSSGDMQISNASEPEIRLTVTNVGATPAHNVIVSAIMRVGTNPLTEPLVLSTDGPPITMVAFPNVILRFKVGLERIPSVAEIRGLKAGELHVYVAGRVDYTDIFGDPQYAEFKMRTSSKPGFNGFTTCEDGNKAS